MTQKSRKKTGKKAQAYSADAMALHLVGGLILIALGVMILLSVVLGMAGDVFAGMRQVCHGLTGSLAFLLPAVPIWGGGLIIMSTQKRAPVRPYALFVGLYVLVLTALNLIATTGSPATSLMQYFLSLNQNRSATPDAFDLFLARAYELGARTGAGGGVMGMVLAWPLWKILGVVPSAILSILGAVGVFLLLIRVDFRKIADMVQQKSGQRRASSQQEQQHLQEQELIWQQQQHQAMAARALPQPRQAAPRQQQPSMQDSSIGWEEYMPQGAYAAPQQGQSLPQQPQRMNQAYIRQQNQQAYAQQMRQVVSSTPGQVGFPPTEEEQWHEPPAPAHKEEKPGRMSKIFSKKKKNEEPEQQPLWQQEDAAPRKGIFDREKTKPRPVLAKAEHSEKPAQKPLREETVQPEPSWQQEDAAPRKGAFDREEIQPRSVPQPIREEPVQPEPVNDKPASEAWPRKAAERPVEEQTVPAAKVRQPAASAHAGRWEPQAPSRATSWRQQVDEAYQQATRAGSQPAEESPAPAPKVKQQPKPSWSETPPWEDAPRETTAPAAAAAPRLQHEPPQGAWKPELKLPPRKSSPEGEQVEMELPPPYVYPGLNLLKAPEVQQGISHEEDAIRSQRLEETLQSFKVPAKVRHVTHGPAISRFELELAAGIKVTKVTDLGKNIAMNMEVKSVRIEAPIPGKALVGVEVPNHKTATVTLREVMESQPMRDAKSPLVVALGKDIAGTPIVCDLARMPHLLIAGATGSGKSVCINTMINSLLYRCSPQEVRMILIDPKVVELQCYNGIPHLLIPVVSDPHKASGALAWAVAEMMDRYKKFERKQVRAIDGYNAKLEDGEEFMPRIVIIIDELADLMMTCKRDVEDHICRLAQLARAAGIHLVVATQRPSVDVITGLIKANIPSRIAFKVSSFIDSRTILDRVGAEQLLGWGDMLYLPTGEFTPIRVQGCFMSDGEVNRVTDFIRENCEAEYDPDVMEKLDQLQREASGSVPSADMVEAEDPNSDDSLLVQSIEMAVNDGQISTSLLQRRLKVGYARAGRLVDEMEKRGVVSAKDGAKPRMCLISREEFERMKENNELDE